ncbi:farnesyl pyrophosphate synthase-like [Solenopsis invicta]|uniref:farnesyl pyrophosphate synthase-like n=1 Tax=Solenopsis invicta TaxID=13686 RepID=UPI00193D7675|nr:farnesyl pyrophosphate synthase-like [Solenopsis invicta]
MHLYITQVLQYNVSRTKHLHSLAVVYAYKSIAPSEQQTEDNIRLARILGWCVEMTLAFMVIVDDIVDQSMLRRGKPCWHRCDETGLMAINDALLIESSLYYLIQKHFKGKECYINLVETFQQVLFESQIGEFLDMVSSSKKLNLDQFTINRRNSIVQSKTEKITFLLPVFLAVHYAGIEKVRDMVKQLETILLEMGHFYQVQDDCLGCFFDGLRKDSTDIEEGRCTWLIIKALERVTPEQRKILEECYGVSDPEKVKRVKQLYIDLDLQNAYFKYEKETYNALSALIQKISCKNLQNFFMGLLGKIYGRRIDFN